MYKTGSVLAFYDRAARYMVVPPNGRKFRHADLPGPIPVMDHDGSPNSPLFHLRRLLPFLGSSSIAYRRLVQAHSQTPSQIFRTLGLAAEYAHPAEVFILGTGTIAGPMLYCYFTRNLHILTVYI